MGRSSRGLAAWTLAAVLAASGPAGAGLVDLLADSLWAEACARAGTREAVAWVALSRDNWCDEFVGDFGRVHSLCRKVEWREEGANRMGVRFFDDGSAWMVELVAPNRLSVFSLEDGHLRQQMVLGRAEPEARVETLHVRCR